jgi:hypothetical protein
MFRIDEALKEFIETGVACVLGTASVERRPHVTYVWGPKVLDSGDTLHVFLERPRATQAVANLEETGLAAVTFAQPVSYRSIQLKGRYRGMAAATHEEGAWVQRHRDAFSAQTALTGDSPGVRRNAWMDAELLRFEIEVEAGYDQTPGPNAGQPL